MALREIETEEPVFDKETQVKVALAIADNPEGFADLVLSWVNLLENQAGPGWESAQTKFLTASKPFRREGEQELKGVLFRSKKLAKGIRALGGKSAQLDQNHLVQRLNEYIRAKTS